MAWKDFFDHNLMEELSNNDPQSPTTLTWAISTVISAGLFIACLVSMIMFILSVDLKGVVELRTNLYIYIMLNLTYLIRTLWWPLKWQKFSQPLPAKIAIRIINRIAFLTNYLCCSAYVQLWLKIIASVVSSVRGKALRNAFIAIDAVVSAIFLGCIIAFGYLEAHDSSNNDQKILYNAQDTSYDITVIVCATSSLIIAILYIIIGSWCLDIVRKTLPDLKGVTTKFIVISTVLFVLSVLRFVFMIYRVAGGSMIQPDCFYIFGYLLCDCNCIPILVMLHSAFQKQRGQRKSSMKKMKRSAPSQKFTHYPDDYSGPENDCLKREEELLMGADINATEFNYQIPF